MRPWASFFGPGIRKHSSGVRRGLCTSCIVVDARVPKPRPDRVTCSLMTVVCPVSFDRCSAVSSLLGGLDVAIGSDRFVLAVTGFPAFELIDVLANQITFDPVASDER